MFDSGLQPRWASPPGATIATALLNQAVSTSEFAQKVGLSLEDAEQLLVGNLKITVELARTLAQVVGASTDFWMTREAQYIEDRARVRADEWSQDLPLAQMVSFGWIPEPQTWRERISVSLDFFAVSDVDGWESRYETQLNSTHFRRSQSFDLQAPATTAWLRAAEQIADSRANLPNYDPASLEAALPHLRKLTRLKDPRIFIPKLVDALGAAGVHVVVIPTPTGCPASGGCRAHSGRPLIQLSARHLSDDHFWFSLFHEIGHALLHPIDDGFIDLLDLAPSDAPEREANEFASENLLGALGKALISSNQRWNHRDVVREAAAIGIAPGILVGQLQHRGSLPKSHLNRLKRRYLWAGNTLLPKT